MALKDKIFRFFGNYYEENDSFKNAEGKGLFQRFIETFPEFLEEDYEVIEQDLIGFLFLAETMDARFLDMMESTLGDFITLSDDESIRRRVIGIALSVHQVRSTKLGYDVLFRLLGFDACEIFTYFEGSGFDSSFTLDDPNRRLDSSQDFRTQYDIFLSGNVKITPEIAMAMQKIIEFNEPIDAVLRNFFYVDLNIDLLDQNAQGDLIYNYNESLSNGISFELSEDGDLLMNINYGGS